MQYFLVKRKYSIISKIISKIIEINKYVLFFCVKNLASESWLTK